MARNARRKRTALIPTVLMYSEPVRAISSFMLTAFATSTAKNGPVLLAVLCVDLAFLTCVFVCSWFETFEWTCHAILATYNVGACVRN